MILLYVQLNLINNPLAHIYFELVLEDLIEKSELSPVNICLKIKDVRLQL